VRKVGLYNLEMILLQGCNFQTGGLVYDILLVYITKPTPQTFASWCEPYPILILIDRQEEWEVEKILDSY